MGAGRPALGGRFDLGIRPVRGAEGLSNPAIARRLYLSRTTVASHVAHILTKLGFSSRAQIAAWAAQRRALAP